MRLKEAYTDGEMVPMESLGLKSICLLRNLSEFLTLTILRSQRFQLEHAIHLLWTQRVPFMPWEIIPKTNVQYQVVVPTRLRKFLRTSLQLTYTPEILTT